MSDEKTQAPEVVQTRTQGENTRPNQVRRATPSVLHSFESLRRGNQELKMRVLQYPQSTPILDIREYVRSEVYTGFTKKGISIDLDQCRSLLAQLPEIVKRVEEE